MLDLSLVPCPPHLLPRPPEASTIGCWNLVPHLLSARPQADTVARTTGRLASGPHLPSTRPQGDAMARFPCLLWRSPPLPSSCPCHHCECLSAGMKVMQGKFKMKKYEVDRSDLSSWKGKWKWQVRIVLPVHKICSLYWHSRKCLATEKKTPRDSEWN